MIMIVTLHYAAHEDEYVRNHEDDDDLDAPDDDDNLCWLPQTWQAMDEAFPP